MSRKALTKGNAVSWPTLPAPQTTGVGEGRRGEHGRAPAEQHQAPRAARLAGVRREVRGHRCVVWPKAGSKQNKVLNIH